MKSTRECLRDVYRVSGGWRGQEEYRGMHLGGRIQHGVHGVHEGNVLGSRNRRLPGVKRDSVFLGWREREVHTLWRERVRYPIPMRSI